MEQNDWRLWGETVTGLAWSQEPDELTFDEALNAYLGRIQVEGAVVKEVQYHAFMGPEGRVVHSALVMYVSPSRVDYTRALDDVLDEQDDYKAAIHFIVPEDLEEVMDTVEYDDES